MLHLSDTTIQIKQSKIYVRLILTCYLITTGLIGYSPTYHWIKAILLILLLGHFLLNFKNKSPCTTIQEIRLSKSQWILQLSDGQIKQYDQANIIIHNVLFQLIRLNGPDHQKLFVIFNDQMTTDQLRLMHLKIATAPNLC